MPLPVIPRHKKTVPKSANRHQQYHFYKTAFSSCIIIAVKEIWSKRSHKKDFPSILPAMWSTAMRTCCLFSQCKVWLRNKFSAMLSKIKKCCSRKLLQCFWGGINLPVRNKLKKKQAYPLIRIYVLGIMLIPIYDISFSLDNKTSCGSPSCFINPKDWIPHHLEHAKHFSSYLLVVHGQEAQVADVKDITYNGINNSVWPCGSLKCSIPCCFLM